MKKITSIILLVAMLLLCGCGAQKQPEQGLGSLKKVNSMDLRYANMFSVDYYEGGYKLITIADEDQYLVVPKGAEVPKGISSDVAVLKQPIENIYLAASASMCLFDALNRLDSIKLSGTQASGWYIENAKKAMEDGKILFAGKYSEPDYELLLDNKCPLAIESTMINHSSEVADKLLELGINVLVDRSSFETHPLGRTEWIKLYAALLNEEDAANNFFNKQVSYMEEAMKQKPTGKTASFFNITAAGKAVCRRSGDYVTEMIKIAGGEYVFESLGDPSSSSATVTIEMETFFAGAKDADYMIYNATISGEMTTMEELLAKSSLLSEFKAVQEGNVWCTDRNLYQDTTSAGEMIGAFQKIFSGEADNLDELPSLRRLK